MKMKQYKTKDYNAPMMFFFLKVYKVTEKILQLSKSNKCYRWKITETQQKKLKIKVKHNKVTIKS